MTATLLILDFSGTLSLGAVRFGETHRLATALSDAGLLALGVTVDRYWNELVGPTWVEGSTSRVGLAALLARQLRAQGISARIAARCARRFTQMYMAASVIDPAWQPLFAALSADSRITTLIATDHYAEATAHIATALAEQGWSARALRLRNQQVVPQRMGSHAGNATAFIANSADLGVIKADPLFWQRVRAGLRANVARIIVVDDFGASENAADFYANPTRVERRRQQTIAAIEQTFAVPVTVVQFVIGHDIGATVHHIVQQINQ
ncbi:hypothetical protein A6A03_08220 [Chloroflexus islandicus]|uniref:Uncharacterized protein n=1 Tax=Chloroflexus islandicus TaxID=1707952 RepID=A0A178MJS5_9CHLR|nr:hypothetical protein [Chloroflexus islandicus]OAN48358.1 hypothetical protein A6A03_08220 [Chloroflexus islandicus]